MPQNKYIFSFNLNVTTLLQILALLWERKVSVLWTIGELGMTGTRRWTSTV